MNRIAIGCLALTLAGCCNREPLDDRLVGVWVFDDRHYSEGSDDGSRGVFWFYADGTYDPLGWSYDVEEDEIYLDSAASYSWDWGTLDGCDLWLGLPEPTMTASYRVRRKKLSISTMSRYEGVEGVSDSLIEAGIWDFWRYD